VQVSDALQLTVVGSSVWVVCTCALCVIY
jgi:hypothetical protein